MGVGFVKSVWYFKHYVHNMELCSEQCGYWL